MKIHAVTIVTTAMTLLACGPALAAPGTQPAEAPATRPAGASPVTQPGRAMPPHGMGGGMGALPPGHPPMGMGRTGPATQPSTQPFTGTLTIKAIQGTRNGPAPAGDEVVIELFARTGMRNISAKLDPQGQTVLDKFQFEGPSQARVTVRHADVPYQAVTGLLHADQPNQSIEVVVYETTSKPVDWHVLMRHVMVQPTPDGLQAMEMFVIRNPSDRAYISEPGPDGQRTSISLTVPPHAAQVAASGMFDECCAKVEPGKLTSTQALVPGNTQVRMGYVVPAQNGKTTLELTAPAPVAVLSVFLPEKGPEVQTQGLQAGEPLKRGDSRMRTYRAGEMEPGQTVSLVIGPAAGGPGAGGGIGGPVAGHEALIMIAAGALVLIALAGLAALRRKRRAAAAAAGDEDTKPDEVQW